MNSWICLAASDASFFGIFNEQIELSNPEFFLEHILILQEKTPAFSNTYAKMKLGDYFREALLGGGGGGAWSEGMLPREIFEILVMFDSI